MSNVPQQAGLTYARLVKAIKGEIASGKKIIENAKVGTYRNVGKYISEYVLHGQDRAKYGARIYEHLEKSLKINKRTLEQAVRFSREFSIANARSQLTWTNYRDLLTLPDPAIRRQLIQQSANKKMTTRELQERIAKAKIKLPGPDDPIPQLKVVRGKLYTYTVIEPASIQPVEGHKFVDVGFNVWRNVPVAQLGKFDNGQIVESVKEDGRYKIRTSDRKADDLYTFKATVERIVDADTMLVHVDLGFDTWTRQRLRFRGIDTPELSTADGQRAKRFIESRIKPSDFVVIKTHKSDKYDRYLVDVFYAPSGPSGASGAPAWDPARVAAEGIYLNQELLDQRLAVRW
jgi:endonuclease YncB( thermonuclease family)